MYSSMTRQSIVYVAILTVLLCMACSSRTELSELKLEKTTQYVYLNGKAFTGTAWSSDGKTISVTCKNGIVQSVIAYHENGAKAIESSSLLGKGKCFDQAGNPVKIDDFIKAYPGLVEQIAAITYEIRGI